MGPLVYMRSTASRKFKSFKGLKKKKLTLSRNLTAHASVGTTVKTDAVYTRCVVVHTLQDTLDQGCEARYSQGSGNCINK